MLLNYRQYSNNGTPLLILHGLFGSLSNWGRHSKNLSEHFAVIGVDLRNHGESFHGSQFNYPIMANDVVELMDHLKISSGYFIGHSMGGKVSMELALTHSDRVEKCIVVDIAPITYPDKADGHLQIISGMKAMALDKISSRKEAEQLLAEFVEDEATRNFVLTNLVRNNEGKYRWCLNLESIENNYAMLREKPSEGEAFTKPTLFIKGAISKYIQSKHEAKILQLFPNANVKIIKQAGHWLHVEQPQVLQKIVLDFLQAKDT